MAALYAAAHSVKFKLAHNHKMRWLLSFTLAFVWSLVAQAKSFTGSRLLVVLEDQAEREKYSVFLEDLTCKLIHSVNCSLADHIQSLQALGIGLVHALGLELQSG